MNTRQISISALIVCVITIEVYANPIVLQQTVQPLQADMYKQCFPAETPVVVYVLGDGSTGLDLYVYDEHGNIIDTHCGVSEESYVAWIPKWTGMFRIEIKNRGFVANTYVMAIQLLQEEAEEEKEEQEERSDADKQQDFRNAQLALGLPTV